MNNMFKKSQAAMEFLMTYGWAILVVLVAIGALAYFGVLSPDRFLPAKCQLPSGIACTDFSVSSANPGINIVIRNGLGFDIDSIVVRVGGCATALTSTGGTSLNNGNQATFTATTALDCGLDTAGGSKFNRAFGITYRNVDSQLTHSVNGTIVARVE